MDQPVPLAAEQPPTPRDVATLHSIPTTDPRPLRPGTTAQDAPAALTVTDDVDDILEALGMPGPGEAEAGIAVQVQQLPTARQRHLFAALMAGATAYAVPPNGPKCYGQTATVRFRHRSELKITFAAAAVADVDERGLWAIDPELLP